MRVAVDTHVLVCAVVGDDPAQAAIAAKVLTDAILVAVALPSLCEQVWVLCRVYAFALADAAAGLAVLDAGGDFADGVIAYEDQWLSGATFMSFDKKAVSLLTAQCHSARLLGR